MKSPSGLWLVLVGLLLGCGAGSTTDAGRSDAGAPDGGAPDAGTPDAGAPDAGVTCASSHLSCGTHGSCADGPNGPACACTDHHGGATCTDCAAGYQDNDRDGVCTPECSTSGLDCSNHGGCYDTSGTATCTCDPHYTGDHCSTCTTGYQDNDHDGTCLPTCANLGLTCNGGGSCDDGTGVAHCVCLEHHEGATCGACEPGYQDNDADGTCLPTCETAALPCPGHASCGDGSGHATCSCDPGWYGRGCDTLREFTALHGAPTVREDSVHVTVDATGNTTVLLRFSAGTTTLGNGLSLTSVGGDDLALVSYDAFGGARWAVRLGSTGDDRAGQLAQDGSGNLFLVGTAGAANVSFGSAQSQNPAGGFIASFSSNGALRWAHALGAEADAVTVDASGVVRVAGRVSSAGADLGNGPLVPPGGGAGLFLLSATNTGFTLWSRVFDDATVQSLACDGAGNVYAAGWLSAAVNLGGGPLSLVGDTTAVVASFDAQGAHRWSRAYPPQAGAPRDSQASQLATDGAGHVTVGFVFRDAIDLGGGLISGVVSGVELSALARLSASDGSFQMSRPFLSGAPVGFGALAYDGAGNLVVGGNVSTAGADFGGGPLSSGAFLAGFDGDLGFRYARIASGGAAANTSGLAVSGDDVLAVGTVDRGVIGWGSGEQPFSGTTAVADLWLARVRPLLPVQAGLAARYLSRLTTTLTLGGVGRVTAWSDLSGHGRDLTGAPGPGRASATVGGLPALDFSAGTSLSSLAFPLSGQVTVFVVATVGAGVTGGALAEQGSTWALSQGSGGSLGFSGGTTSATLTCATGTTAVFVGRVDGTEVTFSRVDGSGTATAQVSLPHGLGAATEVLTAGTSDTGLASNAVLGELLVFDRALSDSEMAQVEDALVVGWHL